MHGKREALRGGAHIPRGTRLAYYIPMLIINSLATETANDTTALGLALLELALLDRTWCARRIQRGRAPVSQLVARLRVRSGRACAQ